MTFKPTRRNIPALLITGILVVSVIVIVANLGSEPDDTAEISGVTPIYPTATVAASTIAAEPTEETLPATTEPEPGTGPWTPCDTSDSSAEDACQDFILDSCDGAYYSEQMDGKNGLLDAFIENKDYVEESRLKDCPQFLPTWRKAKAGFGEGSQEVGKDVKPGTYETTAHLLGGRVTDCYWERSGANGKTIANDFVTAAKKVRVTIRKSDEMFTSEGCGNWMPVG